MYVCIYVYMLVCIYECVYVYYYNYVLSLPNSAHTF